VLGAVNGVLISVVGLQPFITTLVMMLAGRGLAKVITGGQNTSAFNERYRWIANGYVLGLPVVFLASVAVVVVVALVIRRSALGMMIESIGINAEASRLAGLNRRALLITVYIASAFLAGLAGIFSTGTVMTVDVSQTGYQFELDAILAVVIGGTSLAGGRFSLAGAAIGAVLIATLDKTVVFLGVPASATPAFKAAVIIVLYVVQSTRARAWVEGLRRPRPQTGHDVVAT
jgi:simple sugar transport system permease protein